MEGDLPKLLKRVEEAGWYWALTDKGHAALADRPSSNQNEGQDSNG